MYMYGNYLIFPLICTYNVCSSLKEFKYTSHVCHSSPKQTARSGSGFSTYKLIYI